MSWNVSLSGARVCPCLSPVRKMHASPDEEPAEGDDERGNAAVRHDEPGQGADQRAEHETDREGDEPDVGLALQPPIVTSRPKNAMTPSVWTSAIV